MERKLTAILCADVHGYSRLMGTNEEATVSTLNAYRNIIDTFITQHHGRFVGAAGDSVLAEFASVVQAVQCAVDIQASLKNQNAGRPPERRMEFRIGINLGDVIVQGEQLYGDGVNVAARLESLAEPGGILISGSVHEQIKNKLELGYIDLGEQRVKNIAEPIGVFRVTSDRAAPTAEKPRRITNLHVAGISVGTLEIIGVVFVFVQHLSLRPPTTSGSIPPPMHPALTLPDKPSIAVLPFTNVSGDPGQEYFSDGITDDLITHLSRIPNLFVIARTSSFTYKNKPANVRDIGRQLGVRYVLEGSVGKAANQVRITAQLADAQSGAEQWAQTYDRPLRDIFVTQDEIVEKILSTVRLELSLSQSGLPLVPTGVKHTTDNIDAYDYYLRGFAPYFTFTKAGVAKSRGMFERALALDPKYVGAMSMLGFTYLMDVMNGYSADPARDLQRAYELAQKAVALDDTISGPYMLLSQVNLRRAQEAQNMSDAKRYNALAADYANRGIALDPSDPFGYLNLGAGLISLGNPKEGLEAVEKGMRVDPQGSDYYLVVLGYGYSAMGRYTDAIAALKQHLVRYPIDLTAHLLLATCYTETGQKEQARAEVAEVRRINPKFSLKFLQGDPQDRERARFLSDLREAGLS
jgi:adenylate cyclase